MSVVHRNERLLIEMNGSYAYMVAPKTARYPHRSIVVAVRGWIWSPIVKPDDMATCSYSIVGQKNVKQLLITSKIGFST